MSTSSPSHPYNPVPKSGYATAYYVLPPRAMELGDLIEYREMNFNVGNIFKAAYRLGSKPGTSREYDLNKIIYFAERELRRLDDTDSPRPPPIA